jgi:hypothetical protein
MADAASPMDLPLHADLGILAQRGRGVLRKTHQSTPQTWRIPILAELQAAINRFVQETNSDPKPFVWTADPKRVLAAVKRGKQALESDH